MSEGLQYAKKLAGEARASYLKLKAAAEAAVVRWEWATSAIRSHKPAYFEVAKLTRGRALASRPTAGGSGARGYGIDRRELVVVERQLTEFGFYETFFVHEGEGIASYHYSYDPEKSWINVEWLVQGAPGIVEAHSVFARGNWLSATYEYDEAGHVVRCRRQGPNPPYGDVDDVRDIEYDATGQIVRVSWRHPDGSRQVDFERPAKDATLRACREALLEQLTEAIVRALKSASIADEVYALVLSHCEAE